MKRTSLALLLSSALVAPLAPAQTAASPAGAPTASSILSPSLEQLRTSVGNVRVDKWKAPAPVREDATANIGSITRDLDNTLPGLLAQADEAPGVVSKNLPVFRNIDALYDVLLRVVETGDLAAPESDAQLLSNALTSLEGARRLLGDTLQSSAVAAEQRAAALRQQADARTAPAAPETPSVVNDGTKPAPAARKRKAAAAKPKPDASTQPQ